MTPLDGQLPVTISKAGWNGHPKMAKRPMPTRMPIAGTGRQRLRLRRPFVRSGLLNGACSCYVTSYIALERIYCDGPCDVWAQLGSMPQCEVHNVVINQQVCSPQTSPCLTHFPPEAMKRVSAHKNCGPGAHCA